MGNRSYLYLKNQKRELFVFEANNSLPFFWLTLLDRKVLKDKFQDWKKQEQFVKNHSDEEIERYLEINTNTFKISESTFAINSEIGKKFLSKHYPQTLPLFKDFVNSIQTKFETDDILEIDVIQFSNFYNSLSDFYNVLDADLQAIETDNSNVNFLFLEDLIASGTGFESINNKGFSLLPNYQNAIKNRKPIQEKPKEKFNKKALFIACVLLVLCPLFSFLAYKIFQDSEINFFLILLIITNLGFYIFSIWSIIAELKAYKKKHE